MASVLVRVSTRRSTMGFLAVSSRQMKPKMPTADSTAKLVM